MLPTWRIKLLHYSDITRIQFIILSRYRYKIQTHNATPRVCYILLRLAVEDVVDPAIKLLQVSIKPSSTRCFPSWRDVISSKSLQSTITTIRHSINQSINQSSICCYSFHFRQGALTFSRFGSPEAAYKRRLTVEWENRTSPVEIRKICRFYHGSPR